jgi:hypothetical protein
MRKPKMALDCLLFDNDDEEKKEDLALELALEPVFDPTLELALDPVEVAGDLSRAVD